MTLKKIIFRIIDNTIKLVAMNIIIMGGVYILFASIFGRLGFNTLITVSQANYIILSGVVITGILILISVVKGIIGKDD